MNLVEWALTKIFDYKDIRNSDGEVYLRRFFVRGGDPMKPENKEKLVNHWYLHVFYNDDEGDCLHDHPWDFISYILWKGYWEVQEQVINPHSTKSIRLRVLIKPFTRIARPAEWKHQVKLLRKPGTEEVTDEFGVTSRQGIMKIQKAWTFVITGHRRKSWGFFNSKNEFTNWKEWSNSRCD